MGRWATFKLVMPREYYDELIQAMDLARRMGAHNDIEALSYICAEFKTTWEAAEYARPIYDELDKLRREAFDRDGWACLLCHARINLTVHHILPLSLGGPRLDITNLATLCWKCHQKVTNGPEGENWAAVKPQLLRLIGME